MPIVKEKDNNIKNKVYYKVIRTILKYMFCFNILMLYSINQNIIVIKYFVESGINL